MFSKNVYMFPNCSPSSHNSVGLDPNEVFLHHHDMLPGHYSAGEPLAVVNQCTTAKASKKDRHSKIYTAQGPRDRRVRLSIGVARKFFDLQESLGFDKPSKTLDWLLTKSKAAIKDVMQMREKAGTAKDGSSECEVDSAQASENGADLKLKRAAKDPTPASNLAKESRVKARARARERTREKMSIKKLNNNAGYDLNPTIPIQSMNDQLKISGSCSNINMLHCHYPTYESANDHQDLIQESIVIKRKVKHHPSILGFQQNLIMSSSNYGVPSPYNAAADQNWDISCCFTSSQSNI